MEHLWILAPTRQSGRRLREALTVAWRKRGGTALLGLQVAPPSVVFQQKLPEQVAHEFDSLSAWSTVIQHRDPATLPALLPQATEPLTPALAHSYGRRLQQLREQLFDAGLDLNSVSTSPALVMDQSRWKEIASLEEAYRTQLADWDLIDPVDAKHRGLQDFTLPEGTRMILAGVPDPTPIVLTRLKELEKHHPCEVWIHADPSLSERFDDWGTPTSAWETAPQDLGIPSNQWIECFASPDAILHRMNEVATEVPEHPDVALGLLDASLSPALSAVLSEQGSSMYDPSPVSLEHSPVFRLLQALEDHRQRNDPESLRALWRQPALLRALRPEHPGSLLGEWEAYANQAYPESSEAVAFTLPEGELRAAWEQLQTWLQRSDAAGWLQNLQEIHAEDEADPRLPEDRFLIRQLQAASDVLQEAVRRTHAGRPPSSRTLLESLARTSVDPLRVEGTFTAEGWLELLYHPAPQVLLIGMQEGQVPAAPPRDPMLPRQLREDLGLPSDRDWLARDSYLFHCLHSCREPGAVRVWVMKHTRDGTPCIPSRILLACGDDELLERMNLLFEHSPPPPPVPAPSQGLELHPEHLHARTLDRLSVSDVNLYLACPTRFYLQKVLGMQSQTDEATEPDAALFGTLIHAVLEQVVQAGPCTMKEWHQRCEEALQARVLKWMGPLQGMSLELLKHSALKRLRAAGEPQLACWEDGWIQVAFEKKLQRPCAGMTISGKVDRIDHHPEKGYRIIDYKTSESAANPQEMHLGPPREGRESIQLTLNEKTRQWYNLQLPLYRWLSAEEVGTEPLEVLYFNLPSSIEDTGLSGWPGEAGLATQAEECLEAVVQLIQQEVWTPPSSSSTPWDPFRVLLESGTEWIPQNQA